MRRIQLMKTCLVGSFMVGCIMFAACSSKQGSDDSKNEGSNQETKEDQSGSAENDEAPQFNQGQSGGNDSVTDEQLEKFSGAMDANRQIQQDMMPEMEEAVKDAGLSMDEYQKIDRNQRGGGQGMQGGNNDGSSDISEEKLKKFNKAKENLKPVQQEMRNKMEKAIEEEGLSMQEYRSILRQIRQNRELQSRMREMQGQGQQGGNGGQGQRSQGGRQ